MRTIPSNVSQTRVEKLQNVRQCDIMANYVPILVTPNKELQMYRIDFEPSVESASLMRFLFKEAAKEKFTGRPIYDGVHECRSEQKLTDKVTSVRVKDKGEEEKEYRVTFTNTGTTIMGSEMIRTYNLHMKEFFRIMKFFSPQPGLHVHPAQSFNVGEDIMILRGFKTAANIHDEGRLLMNFEAAHKLIQRRNVCELMHKIRRNSQGGDFREAIQSALTGKLVVTSYNKRAYRVEEVDFSSNPQSKFSKKDGSEISYIDYFKSVYNYDVKDKMQPLLTVIPSNKRRRGDEEPDRVIKLIPEMCNIAGLTEEQRNDNRLKMDLIRASQVPPKIRVEQLRSFLEAFHKTERIQEQLSTWGYGYGKDALKIKGFIVAPTAIGSGSQAKEAFDRWGKANPESADFNVRSLAASPTVQRLALIVGRGDIGNKGKIVQTLRSGFGGINLSIQQVETHDIEEGDQAAHYVRKIKSLSDQITVAIIVMRNQNKVIYDAVKKTATAEMGLTTQVVTSKLLMDDRKARSAATKIAIQIAAKVGGEPWWVDIPLKGTMVCGYDTHHDTTKRGRSFGAFLASLNDRFSKWFSKADAHDKLDEVSTQVAVNMIEALETYRKVNDRLPERVLIYRDGVSEGMIEHVYKNELKNIKERVEALDGKIRFAMILVNKSVGARFFMRSTDNNFINPPPGTVIDHAVTRQDRYDFYLISQSTRQGTISPTYYNIIHDEVGFGPEIHQKMAYKLCSLYYNWSGTVRVPAPCQYAHKLAKLCGENMHAQPNAVMNQRLHFL